MIDLPAKKRGPQLARALTGIVAAALVTPMALAGPAAASARPKPPNVTVIMGTTDRIVSADPAGSYDLPSWTIIYNVYQTLLSVPPGTSNIQPDAASCHFTDPKTYVCTLKANQEFSNGDPVTGQDVAYSFNR